MGVYATVFSSQPEVAEANVNITYALRGMQLEDQKASSVKAAKEQQKQTVSSEAAEESIGPA